MDQQAKYAIKSMVLKLRRTLEEEIEIQLKRYGFSDKRWRSLDDLPHIKEDDREKSRFFCLSNALKQHMSRIDADPDNPSEEERAKAIERHIGLSLRFHQVLSPP